MAGRFLVASGTKCDLATAGRSHGTTLLPWLADKVGLQDRQVNLDLDVANRTLWNNRKLTFGAAIKAEKVTPRFTTSILVGACIRGSTKVIYVDWLGALTRVLRGIHPSPRRPLSSNKNKQDDPAKKEFSQLCHLRGSRPGRLLKRVCRKGYAWEERRKATIHPSFEARKRLVI